MFSRRHFMGASLGMAGLAACGRSATAVDPYRQDPRSQIGVQLYTLRDVFQPDPVGTLQAVRKVGYDFVEFGGGGYHEMDHAELARVMADIGLSASSAHVGLEAITDNLAASIDMGRVLGVKYLVVPWVEESHRTQAGYQRIAQQLNGAAETARAAGLRLAYHNHDFEFDTMADGRTGMQILMEETDPALVDCELDLFWATLAGANINAFFAAYPGRTRLCHVKDMDENRNMVNVGAGQIDFAGIFANSDVAGLDWRIVEHDNPAGDPIAAVAESFAHMVTLRS